MKRFLYEELIVHKRVPIPAAPADPAPTLDYVDTPLQPLHPETSFVFGRGAARRHGKKPSQIREWHRPVLLRLFEVKYLTGKLFPLAKLCKSWSHCSRANRTRMRRP
jgi:hypothetical protein